LAELLGQRHPIDELVNRAHGGNHDSSAQKSQASIGRAGRRGVSSVRLEHEKAKDVVDKNETGESDVDRVGLGVSFRF